MLLIIDAGWKILETVDHVATAVYMPVQSTAVCTNIMLISQWTVTVLDLYNTCSIAMAGATLSVSLLC